MYLHLHHKREYQRWNDYIASFGSALDQLIDGPVLSALPAEARTDDTLACIRAQLTSAYLECVYSPLSDVDLVYRRMEWFMTGHFPCGWSVESESEFPERAMSFVF